MSEQRQMELLIIRYVVGVDSKQMDVGIVLFQKNRDFAKARFVEDVEQILSVDPDADLDWLRATFHEIKTRLEISSERQNILQMLEENFSGTLQVVGPSPVMASDEPMIELDKLSALYLARLT